jgi:hypothetical protein
MGVKKPLRLDWGKENTILEKKKYTDNGSNINTIAEQSIFLWKNPVFPNSNAPHKAVRFTDSRKESK